VWAGDENSRPSFHEKIRIAKVREYDFVEVEKQIYKLIEVAYTFHDMDIVHELKRIVPEYEPDKRHFVLEDDSKKS